jgi:hypothetical protein
MLYLALGFVALALFLAASGRRKPVLKRREWRFLSGAFALAAFTGAAWLGVRGAWGSAIVLVVVGLGFAVSTRRTGMAPPTASSGRMSVAEARRILGVEEGATREEIQAAYTRLMRLAHPDRGGTAGLAAQLNAARDRLLSK